MFNRIIGFLAAVGMMGLFALLIADGRAENAPLSSRTSHPPAAVILTYFSVSDDFGGFAGIDPQSFAAHMDFLKRENISVIPLSQALKAIDQGTMLPDASVVITFEDADRSVLLNALPVLKEHGFPFTVFLSLTTEGQQRSGALSHKDIKTIKDTGLAEFGLHGTAYRALTGLSDEDIRRDVNAARADLRDLTGQDPVAFAYPYGAYDDRIKALIESLGFPFALAQQSGVAFGGSDRAALPRFTLTERYGDLDRLEMLVHTLPLEAKDITPKTSTGLSANPAIGFTLPDDLVKDSKSLDCFISSNEKPKLEILNKSRVELRLPENLLSSRVRINCTMPGVKDTDGTVLRWRWLGFMLILDRGEETDPKEDAADTSGFSSAE
jgi:peptidoglycan/xylan/chitin deacetylase (PgdA/CDA1 family)